MQNQSCAIYQEEKNLVKAHLKGTINLLSHEFTLNCLNRNKDLIQFSPAHRFVCIGSGPLPATLYMVYQRNIADELVGIDHDGEALRLSKQLFDNLGIKNFRFDSTLETVSKIENKTLWYIANLVLHKKEIVSQILSLAHSEDIIILRISADKNQSPNDLEAMRELCENCEALGQGEASQVFNSKNLFFRY